MACLARLRPLAAQHGPSLLPRLAPSSFPSRPAAPLLLAARWNRKKEEKKRVVVRKKRVPHIDPPPTRAETDPAMPPRGLMLPDEMPSTWLLKQLTFRHPASHFRPHKSASGAWRPPKISLRNQARIRKAALLCGIDPVAQLGMPEKKENWGQRIVVLPEGKGDVERYLRRKKISEAMATMDERVKTWKERKRARRERRRAIPRVPF
ncbi:hypothetical protein DFJ74DRAFT_680283 [Hyaloraphidium curvatum]|nr:hypothetical protein DFJ74DRAFT_680283 [Hyaloraphidium curvatum]